MLTIPKAEMARIKIPQDEDWKQLGCGPAADCDKTGLKVPGTNDGTFNFDCKDLGATKIAAGFAAAVAVAFSM